MLPDALYNYNNKHSSTKFKLIELFHTMDENILKQALINIKKSKNKYNNYDDGFKIWTKYLLSENFVLKDKSITYKKFKKKGKYSIPCTIIGIQGGNDCIITLPINFNNLKKDIKYYVDYHMIMECNPNLWDKILSDLNNNI